MPLREFWRAAEAGRLSGFRLSVGGGSGRRRCGDGLSQLLVRRRIDLAERCRLVGDLSVRTNHEDAAIVQLDVRLPGAVQLTGVAERIGQECEWEVRVFGPGSQRGCRVRADREQNNISPTLEQRRVLITVRVHLDGSAFGPRLVKEGKHHGLPLEVMQRYRALLYSVTSRRSE